MELWNQKHLAPPPTLSFKAESRKLDLQKVRNTFSEAIKHFKNEEFLTRESALLSRITYRMKMKFRNSKDFKTLEKINHALRNYFESKIVSDLKKFLDCCPRRYNDDATYLPTKNMLTYVLIKLQGLAKVMERVYDSCKIAAGLFMKRLCLGHFWKIAIIAYGVVSRIFFLAKFNTKFICDLYGKLYSYLTHLKNPGVDWLPNGYILPVDLREWLQVPWVYEEDYVDLTFEPAPKIFDFFNLCSDEEDVEFCDEYVVVNDEDKAIESDYGKLRPLKEQFGNNMRGFNVDDDFGDLIEITDTDSSEILFYEPENSENEIAVESIDVGEQIIAPNLEETRVIVLNDTKENESKKESVILLSDTTQNSDTELSTNRAKTRKKRKVKMKDRCLNREEAPRKILSHINRTVESQNKLILDGNPLTSTPLSGKRSMVDENAKGNTLDISIIPFAKKLKKKYHGSKLNTSKVGRKINTKRIAKKNKNLTTSISKKKKLLGKSNSDRQANSQSGNSSLDDGWESDSFFKRSTLKLESPLKIDKSEPHSSLLILENGSHEQKWKTNFKKGKVKDNKKSKKLRESITKSKKEKLNKNQGEGNLGKKKAKSKKIEVVNQSVLTLSSATELSDLAGPSQLTRPRQSTTSTNIKRNIHDLDENRSPKKKKRKI